MLAMPMAIICLRLCNGRGYGYDGVTCSKRKRTDPVSMSVTLSARLGAW